MLFTSVGGYMLKKNTEVIIYFILFSHRFYHRSYGSYTSHRFYDRSYGSYIYSRPVLIKLNSKFNSRPISIKFNSKFKESSDFDNIKFKIQKEKIVISKRRRLYVKKHWRYFSHQFSDRSYGRYILLFSYQFSDRFYGSCMI